jgi:CheY-like chemotaxis protein
MRRILVVDDEAVAVNALCSLLEMDGYAPVGVCVAEEAVRRLRSEAFDAVITDLEMPGVHGLEVVRAAREAHAAMPVLVVTAYGNSPVSDSALVHGARCVLGKPLKYERLLAELARCAPP